jgi:PncC family amidohydrolase
MPVTSEDSLAELALRVARRLIERGETVALCETAAGGLASAALLAVPGTSACFVGSALAYSRHSRRILLGLEAKDVAGLEPLSEDVARVFASRCRTRLGAAWGLAELGIAGPTPSPYGGPAGVAVLAVDGPVSRARRLETGHADRAGNMRAFAEALLALLSDALDEATAAGSAPVGPPGDRGT